MTKIDQLAEEVARFVGFRRIYEEAVQHFGEEAIAKACESSLIFRASGNLWVTPHVVELLASHMPDGVSDETALIQAERWRVDYVLAALRCAKRLGLLTVTREGVVVLPGHTEKPDPVKPTPNALYRLAMTFDTRSEQEAEDGMDAEWETYWTEYRTLAQAREAFENANANACLMEWQLFKRTGTTPFSAYRTHIDADGECVEAWDQWMGANYEIKAQGDGDARF